jgi:hypothetical protein
MPNQLLTNVDETMSYLYLAHDHAKASGINNGAREHASVFFFVDGGKRATAFD